MKDFNKLNTIIGWLVGIAACSIFFLTSESTASFWDCGEFISCSYKLEVGHPPGAPTFLLLGRLISLLSFGNTALVAPLINHLCGICSGFSVMFCFWIITYMGRKFFINGKGEEMDKAGMYAVFGAGIVGAVSFIFCDSLWFSAVEGIVWAMASFFTSAIFWCATKWDRETNQRDSFHWIILIGFLIGLSIGVHLLNLLAIPAMGFLFYFKYYKPSFKGILIASLVSLGITGAIFSIIIPKVVDLFAKTELFFVNTLGMPFNSGSLFLALLFIALITGGVLYTTRPNLKPAHRNLLFILSAIFLLLILIGSTGVGSFIMRLIMAGLLITLFYYIRNKKAVMNTLILTFAFMLIGYSTYLILIIRANAETPLNENKPKNAIALLSYLNREQYGDWPVLYGQYYNAPLDSKQPYNDGTPYYSRDDKAGKYVITDDRKGSVPNFDSRFCTMFPRMWKTEKASLYKDWVDIKGTPITVSSPNGEPTVINRPNFSENLAFFWRYQFGFMYWRYFFWNFIGRQNDVQGFGKPLNGNWISGIDAIDESLVGPVDLLPDNLKNKGTTHFYFLPLLLGLIGMFYHFKHRYQDGLVVLLFFFMTGLAIILYLNQGPAEPRERDYAYAGSMMAFCIWIGMGVIAIFNQLKTKIKPVLSAIIVTIVCFAAVPYVMGKNGWTGHDRSGRYTMFAVATDYLNSCAPNAILFTNGDNDTFPLWYAQEVMGVRRDVRVVNLSLLNTDSYIYAMTKKAYESDPLPISMAWNQYRNGTRDAVYIYDNENVKGSVELKQLMNFALSEDPTTKLTIASGKKIDYFPTHNVKLTVDKKAVLASGTVPPEKADSIVDVMEWNLKGYGVQKNDLTLLDILANNNWKRPIYFSITTGDEAYIGLQKYFQEEGLAFRLVPLKSHSFDGQTGEVYSKAMYDNVMNKFQWGNMQDSTVYLDETNIRMTMNFRNLFSRLAGQLIIEGKKDSAVKVLDKCMAVMPESSVPYNYFVMSIAEAYYQAGATAKANKLMTRLIELYRQNFVYLFAFTGTMAADIDDQKDLALRVMNRIAMVTGEFKQDTLSKKAKGIFDNYYSIYSASQKENPAAGKKRRTK
ncbi:MAG: DUF2723 domain-containing protein [Bacteroidales bacterium]|jgi:hypothetical protein